MKSKIFVAVIAGLCIAQHAQSKTIPSGMALVINDFLKEEESMPFVHEIVKTSRLAQTVFQQCEKYKEQQELCQTRSSQGQPIDVKKDYYALLSVTPQTTQEEIKIAYEAALKKIESVGEDATIQRKNVQEAYDVLGEPFKKAHYYLEKDIAQFITAYKKRLFDERADFLEILYDSRSFVDSIFKIVIENIHPDGTRPIMTRFIETATLDKDFFTKNVTTLDQLYKVSLELKEFSSSLKDIFSAAVKKNFNIWIRKQKH